MFFAFRGGSLFSKGLVYKFDSYNYIRTKPVFSSDCIIGKMYSLKTQSIHGYLWMPYSDEIQHK